jgi:hypothetical protein
MRINTDVLAIELKLCLVVATTQPDFMNFQKAADVQQVERLPLPDRKENYSPTFESLNLPDPGKQY